MDADTRAEIGGLQEQIDLLRRRLEVLEERTDSRKIRPELLEWDLIGRVGRQETE